MAFIQELDLFGVLRVEPVQVLQILLHIGSVILVDMLALGDFPAEGHNKG